MNEERAEIAAMIEAGHLTAALARLCRLEAHAPSEPETWDVDEHQVTALIAQRMAAWGADFARSVDQHVATVLNRLRGRVD